MQGVGQAALLHCQFDEGQTYLRSVILESLRASARAITPDMSLPPRLVRLLPARLRAKVGRKHTAVSECESRPYGTTAIFGMCVGSSELLT